MILTLGDYSFNKIYSYLFLFFSSIEQISELLLCRIYSNTLAKKFRILGFLFSKASFLKKNYKNIIPCIKKNKNFFFKIFLAGLSVLFLEDFFSPITSLPFINPIAEKVKIGSKLLESSRILEETNLLFFYIVSLFVSSSNN